MLFKIYNLAFALILLGCTQGYKFDLTNESSQFKQNIQYNNKVDIIWIIDNSSSMKKHQDNLILQVPNIVSRLNSLKMDYHLAVVSTSMGGANPTGGRFIGEPKYVTRDTPQLVSVIKSKFSLGENGSNNERGMESLENSLSEAYLASHASGFFRNDALLTIIALSDEDDKSAQSSAYYKNFFDQLKPDWSLNEKAWLFNFIGVLDLNSCKTFNDYAEPGLLFVDLVDYTGGSKESICTTDLSVAVGNIQARVISKITEYKLGRLPVVSTIRVYINGILINQNPINGWEYIEGKNTIRFNGTAVPPADALVKVDFKPLEAK